MIDLSIIVRKIMARTKATPRAAAKSSKIFMNVPISPETRNGLHVLKDAMAVDSQAEVIEKLVKMGLALQSAMQK